LPDIKIKKKEGIFYGTQKTEKANGLDHTEESMDLPEKQTGESKGESNR
jgi:hypothetical protein